MDGKTIKTLAEYIVSLHHKQQTLDQQYDSSVTDTNGVKQDWDEADHIETFWPPSTK
jgi:hypothetical protein